MSQNEIDEEALWIDPRPLTDNPAHNLEKKEVSAMNQLTLSCYNCGRGLHPRAGRPPCEELTGWITVSFWRRKGLVEHVNFCSVDCLHDSLIEHITPVPEVFLRSFDKDDQDIEE